MIPPHPRIEKILGWWFDLFLNIWQLKVLLAFWLIGPFPQECVLEMDHRQNHHHHRHHHHVFWNSGLLVNVHDRLTQNTWRWQLSLRYGYMVHIKGGEKRHQCQFSVTSSSSSWKHISMSGLATLKEKGENSKQVCELAQKLIIQTRHMEWIFLAKCTVVVRIFCTSEFSEPCVFIVHVRSLFGDWPHILHWTSPVWTRSGGSLNWTKLDQHVGLWGDAKLNALEFLCWQGRLGTRVRSNMDGWMDWCALLSWWSDTNISSVHSPVPSVLGTW